MQQTSEPDKLRSLLRCSSKLSRSRAKKLRSLLRCNKQAPEFAALQQQALTLWSLLLQRSKLSRSRACCCNAASSHALELVTLQQASSGVCCVAAASSHASDLAAAMQQAPEPRSSGAWCVARFSCSKQASKLRSSGEAPKLGACLPLQTKQTKIK